MRTASRRIGTRMATLAAWVLVASAAWVGCAEEVDELHTATTTLMSASWRIDSIVMIDEDGVETDVFSDWGDCAKDNELEFLEAGTFALTEGATACSVPVDESGTWELFRDENAAVGDLVTDVLLQSGESIGFGLHHKVKSWGDSEWIMELDRFDGTPGIIRYVLVAQ